ncbi:MAG: helix-turn-helix transcriptional regulator [Trueperaceae bacterium]|nr:helix-turn-helix transcriptional regulator [Trueperaceae bacterium]MCC6312116.1 helix-turn-helix transcriptional regulator [Trueperaceae bacterium]MCW5819128.1 helix-turn-helix transcriptional regulator [Trueperaceae bacterium]
MATPHRPSLAVRRALRELGHDVKVARLRRNLTMDTVAERAFTSRPTLQRLEAGDPGVGMGIYASVLQALGLLENLGKLAGPGVDEIGLAHAEQALPRRARSKRNTSKGASDEG